MRPLAPALLLLAACGTPGGPPADDLPADTDLPVACSDAPVQMHRLTRRAFDRSLRDVFGLDTHPGATLPSDSVADGFETTSAGQTVGGAWLPQAFRAAGDVAEAVLAVPAWRWTEEAEGFGLDVPQLDILVGEPGRFIYLNIDATVTRTVEVPVDGLYRVGFRGSPLIVYQSSDSGPAPGSWPEIDLRLDGVDVGTIVANVDDLEHPTWGLELELTAGAHEVRWRFDTWPSWVLQLDRLEVERVTRTLAQRATPLRDRILTCDPYVAEPAACLDQILGSVGRRLWRRPLTADELARLRALVPADDVDAGLAAALHHLMASPRFLYLPEPGVGGAPRALSPWEVSARLADVLWASVPDDVLLDCAAAGGLGRDDAGPCGLDAQVDRMLADARADAVLFEFLDAWTGLVGFTDGRLVDAEAFDVPPELLASMLGEVHALFGDALRRDAPVSDLFAAPGALVDATLAAHYGLPAPGGEGFVAVEDAQRGGLVRTAALLLATSEPSRSSPVRRGVLVQQKLLCQVLGDRPSVVPDLPVDPVDPTAALDAHAAIPGCASCHQAIDPVGLALEAYDPLGRVRDDLGSAPLPGPRAAPDGTVLDHPEDLVAWIAAHPDLEACFTSQLASWALRRDVPLSEAECRRAAGPSDGVVSSLRALLRSGAFLSWTGAAP